MKIQLDTTNKKIKIEEEVNLNELIKVIRKLLPNNEWKEFTLETNTTIEWINPIVWQPYQPYTYPWYDYTTGTATAENYTQYSLTNGTYNIEYTY